MMINESVFHAKIKCCLSIISYHFTRMQPQTYTLKSLSVSKLACVAQAWDPTPHPRRIRTENNNFRVLIIIKWSLMVGKTRTEHIFRNI